MLELIRDSAALAETLQGWLLAQPVAIQLAVAVAALAVLWVLWILLRVILVALRAAFRGL